MQYQPKNNYKIYSRARLNIAFLKNTPKSHKSRRKIKKTMPVISIFSVAIITCFSIWNFVNPMFETLCKDKAKSVATIISNEETTKMMEKYNYDTFFTIQKDEKGNIQMINANVLKINQVTSDIALSIQKRLDENQKNSVYISLGAITGIKYLSGFGPKINIDFSHLEILLLFVQSNYYSISSL